MRNIKFGGDLQKGDFIAYSYTNYINFGWYVGDGQGGSLQFYNWCAPADAKNSYDKYLSEEITSNWIAQQYKNGFTLKNVYKDYIIMVDDNRVCKINPMDIFTNKEDMIRYEKSRKVLINFNFIER